MSTRTTVRRLTAGLVVLSVLLLTPGLAVAHAELLETTPADGTTVEGTPTEIVAIFSEGLLAEGSGLSLRDADGDRLATGDVDPDDLERLVITDVPELAPGEYEARWTARTDDGHLERGTWTFTVTVPATPSPTPSPTPVATASAAPSSSPTAAPSPTVAPSATADAGPSPSPDPGAAGSDQGGVLLPILAGLAIVAVVGGVLLGRRGRTPAA